MKNRWSNVEIMGFRSLAALVLAMGIAIGAPRQELQILPNGHVRLNGGSELDLPHFREELKHLSDRHVRREIDVHVDAKARYDTVAAVLAALQRADFKIGIDRKSVV